MQENETSLSEEQRQQLQRQQEQSLRGTTQSMDSLFQIDRLSGKKKIPWYYKFDIFQFLPIPTQKPVSTRFSFIGSIIFIVLILAFAIFTFVRFLTSNAPSVSQYFQSLGDGEYSAPEFAVGFYFGDDVLKSFDLSKGDYFDLTIHQVIRDQDFDGEYPKIDIHTVMGKDCDFDWLGDNIDTKYLMCPDYKKIKAGKAQNLYVQGNASFKRYQYPQILVQLCRDDNPKVKCQSKEEIDAKLAGGRIQVYLKKNPSKNYLTNEIIDFNRDYLMYYYFLVRDQYFRHTINYQIQEVNQSPNYFTSFSTETTNTFYIKDQTFYPSKVIYDPSRIFSIWMTLDSNIVIINYSYTTIVVVGSLLGSFCSVIFSAFAFFFMRYNSKAFYKKNKKWDDIKPLVNQIRDINVSRNNSLSIGNNQNDQINQRPSQLSINNNESG